jgi:hypothetical protein
MTYEEFLDFVPAKCMYETIYDDSDGRPILVIRMLDAYGMVNKAQRPWVGLTDEELSILGEKFTHPDEGIDEVDFGMEIQRILKENNT